MKKTIVYFGMFLFLSILFVSAQEVEDETLIDAGLASGDVFYFLDIMMENLDLALTFDNEMQIEKKIKIAEERLAEAQKVGLEGDLEKMENIQKRYAKMILKIKSDIENIEEENETEELKMELRVEEKIREHEKKVEFVNNNIKIKIKTKGELTEEQMKSIGDLISSFGNNSEDLRIEIKNQKDKTKVKIEIKGGDGDEIEAEFEEENNIVANKEDAREEIGDAREEIGEAEKKINEKAEEGDEVEAAEMRLKEAKQMLEKAIVMYNKTNYQAAESLAENAERFAKQARMKFLGKTLEELSDEFNDSINDSKDKDDLESESMDNDLEDESESESNESESKYGETREFTIVAKKWEFEPNTLTVNKGDLVKLRIESIDVDHGISLPAFGINERLEVDDKVDIEFVADKEGVFPFSCSVYCGSGHGGMDGQLIVE